MKRSQPSSPEEDQFSTVWPELSARLRRVLHSRRVPADLVDDFVQETGLRLFRNWSKVDQATLWALANTILLNLVRDEVRKNEVRKRDARLLVAERVRNFDEEMLSHLELRRVEKVLRKLSDVDQQVLLAEWGECSNAEFVSPAALKMARMRARQRLRAALEHASELVPAWWRIRRALVSKNSSVLNVSEQLSHIAAAGVLVFAGVVGSVAGVARDDDGSTFDAGPGATQAMAASIGSEDSSDLFEGAPASSEGRGDPAAGSDPSASISDGAEEASDLNENFGPVRSDDDGTVHIGEGGPLGPYGADRTVEASPAGHETKARARARYETPTCEGEIHIGGQSDPYECEPGNGSAGAETEAEGQHHEAGTPSR